MSVINNQLQNNNFDLIRLLAALQVLIIHYTHHLGLGNIFIDLLKFLPGVPIFFFLSGYLITSSWLRLKSDKLKNYSKNRFLRLYPALITCIIVTIISIVFSGYSLNHVEWQNLAIWIFTQVSFLQFYNPEFMDNYATGTFNGSLWTISVEIQFYILTPIITFLILRYKKIFILIFIFFVACNLFNSFLNERSNFLEKLFSRSAMPWLYMYIFGSYLAINQNLAQYALRN